MFPFLLKFVNIVVTSAYLCWKLTTCCCLDGFLLFRYLLVFWLTENWWIWAMGVASTFHFLNRYRCQINWRGQKPTTKKQKNVSTEGRCVVGLKKSIRRKAGEKSNKEKFIFLHCKFATFIMWMYLYELELIMDSNSFQTVIPWDNAVGVIGGCICA